jgi:hypothetical protein
MTLDDAAALYRAVLAERFSALAEALRQVVAERPFALDPGVSIDTVDAVHFEYEWDSFQPVAIPLNAGTGYCGRGQRLAVLPAGESWLFPEAIDHAVAAAAPEIDPLDLGDELGELKTRLFTEWFIAVWREIRGAAPAIRGFLSVHDTIWRTDLDTGDEFRTDSGRVKFF